MTTVDTPYPDYSKYIINSYNTEYVLFGVYNTLRGTRDKAMYTARLSAKRCRRSLPALTDFRVW